MNMKLPVIKATIDPTKTAPAAKSFVFLMRSCLSFETKSDKFSIAELTDSKHKTSPIEKIIALHSIALMLK